MMRDKTVIAEMAEIIAHAEIEGAPCQTSPNFKIHDHRVVGRLHCPSCQYACDNGWSCQSNATAKALYDAGYRKVDDQPVRCCKCKHWRKTDDIGDDVGYCTNPDGLDNYAKSNDFCSYGEPKEDDA